MEYKINKHLSLKLDSDTGETLILVNNKKIIICKSLFIQIPKNKFEIYDEISSIDEITELTNEVDQEYEYELPFETKFWGHCSNLQAWYESEYNTRILVKHVAFPLLKKLTEARDPLAKKVFKEEIASRYSSGDPTVMEYLKNEGYLEYLDEDELNSIH